MLLTAVSIGSSIGQVQRYSQNDQLHGIAKGDINQRTNCVSQAACNAFCSMTQQPSQGDDSYSVHAEDDGRVQPYSFDGDTHRHKDEQDIDPAMAQGRLGVMNKSDRAILHADQGTWFWFLRFVFRAGPQVCSRGPSGRIHFGMLGSRAGRFFVRRRFASRSIVGVV